MLGRETLLRALRGETTARPAWLPFVGVHGGKLIGVSAEEYLKSADHIVAGLKRAHELYRPDGLPVVFDLQMEAEVLGCQLAWAEETPPSVASHPLAGGGKIQDLPVFDVWKGRFPIALSALERIRHELGEQVAMGGLITGPFTLASHLRGTELFMDLMMNPDCVRELLHFCTIVAVRAANGHLAAGADFIAVVDPMTSQISPDHFSDFVAPPLNAIFDHIRARGGLSSLFVCGDATRNLEVMCQTSCDSLSIDENISLEKLAALTREHGKSFGGNLKLTVALLLGSEVDCQRDAIRCLDTGGDTGFILAPGCDLPYATPEANLQAVATVVHDPYQREVARTSHTATPADTFDDIVLPDYDHEESVIVDVVTLDSTACAPCQYMLGAVMKAKEKTNANVTVREHMIKNRDGLGHMVHLGVASIPSICIDGEVKFASVIPDTDTLAAAIVERANAKAALAS